MLSHDLDNLAGTVRQLAGGGGDPAIRVPRRVLLALGDVAADCADTARGLEAGTVPPSPGNVVPLRSVAA